MEIKRELARSIVNMYHDSEKALAAERHFDSVVVKKEFQIIFPFLI